jgi:hypothetical protein
MGAAEAGAVTMVQTAVRGSARARRQLAGGGKGGVIVVGQLPSCECSRQAGAWQRVALAPTSLTRPRRPPSRDGPGADPVQRHNNEEGVLLENHRSF